MCLLFIFDSSLGNCLKKIIKKRKTPRFVLSGSEYVGNYDPFFTLYVLCAFVMPYSEIEFQTGMPLSTDASVESFDLNSSVFVLSFISVSIQNPNHSP